MQIQLEDLDCQRRAIAAVVGAGDPDAGISGECWHSAPMVAEMPTANSTPHAAGKHWPRAVRENARLAFLAGRVALPVLARETGIPLDTLKRWSRAERWTRSAAEIAEASDTEATRRLADWLASEKVEHVQRAIVRVKELLGHFDGHLAADATLRPRDLRMLAEVLDKADVIFRRNAGSDERRTAPFVSVNILSGAAGVLG